MKLRVEAENASQTDLDKAAAAAGAVFKSAGIAPMIGAIANFETDAPLETARVHIGANNAWSGAQNAASEALGGRDANVIVDASDAEWHEARLQYAILYEREEAEAAPQHDENPDAAF